jgi:hypothetical protein
MARLGTVITKRIRAVRTAVFISQSLHAVIFIVSSLLHIRNIRSDRAPQSISVASRLDSAATSIQIIQISVCSLSNVFSLSIYSVTVWSLSYLNIGWCLTLGEMLLPILH